MASVQQTPTAAGPSSALVELVREARVLLVVGAGGVGKTTVSAALAFLCARSGRDTLVMTIDPARRLAVSLGLDRLDLEPAEIPAQRWNPSEGKSGALFASMLDQKQAFDQVVERYATDAAALERIKRNKLYRELSTRLAGGQEYAAMEKLYETLKDPRFACLVLDTPPAANAVDFLEAPRKMVALLDGPAVRIFLDSYRLAGRFSLRLLRRGPAYVFRRLIRFVGGAFLDDVAAFFGDMHALLGGFRARAAAVVELLRRDDVAFVLVTTPDARAIDDAIALYRRLNRDRMRPGAFVINRVHELATDRRDHDSSDQSLQAIVEQMDIDHSEQAKLVELLQRSHRQLEGLADADARQIARLVEACGDDHAYVQVPLLADDVYDMHAILLLVEHLSGTSPDTSA